MSGISQKSKFKVSKISPGLAKPIHVRKVSPKVRKVGPSSAKGS